nr:hypothetical protein CFP56_61018 [Quercus suber]
MSGRAQHTLLLEHRINTMDTVAEKTRSRELGSVTEVEAKNKEDLTQTSMDVESSGSPQSNSGTARFEETMTQQNILDFEACVKDINDAENTTLIFMLSSVGDPEIHTNNIGKDFLINSNTTLLLDSESGS